MRRKKKVDHNESGTLLYNKLSFAATEAYKLLRTNLIFSLPGERKCRVIGITSAERGEGKSTTAVNLAYVFAEMGKKVLLIDGDLRLPSVAKRLEMENTKGITDLLIGSVKKEDVILDSQILDNWNVMTSGYIPPNPTEILGSDQMKNLIDELREEYEIIIVDLPPVNIVSDALVVSPYLDGMVVVVRENYSDIRSLDACINQLGLAGVKLLGLIMTVSENSGVGYGKYRYKYK